MNKNKFGPKSSSIVDRKKKSRSIKTINEQKKKSIWGWGGGQPRIINQPPPKSKQKRKGDLAGWKSVASRDSVQPTFSRPTLSSALKMRGKFNLKEIPFVVGRSTTKSHNLGLKIQETLSLMKKSKPQKRYSTIKSSSSFEPKKIGDKLTEAQIFSNSPPTGASATLFKIEDVSQGSLKTVFVNLHKEFAGLMETLEKLKKNKSDHKKIQEFENILSKKEMEISVMMGLYNEVIKLREEVKRLQKKSAALPHVRVVSKHEINNCFGKSGKMKPTLSVTMTRLMRNIQRIQSNIRT